MIEYVGLAALGIMVGIAIVYFVVVPFMKRKERKYVNEEYGKLNTDNFIFEDEDESDRLKRELGTGNVTREHSENVVVKEVPDEPDKPDESNVDNWTDEDYGKWLDYHVKPIKKKTTKKAIKKKTKKKEVKKRGRKKPRLLRT